MSLFPDEDVLAKEIEAWRDYVDKLPDDEDKVVLTKLLDSCYKYSVDHAQTHSFPSESLIMSLLLNQHKLIDRLKSMMQSMSKQISSTMILTIVPSHKLVLFEFSLHYVTTAH
jgi:hypothetical protein